MAGATQATPSQQAGLSRKAGWHSKGVLASHAKRFSNVIAIDQEPHEYMYSVNAGNLENVHVRVNGKWMIEGQDYITKSSTRYLKRATRFLEFTFPVKAGDHVELNVP